MQDRLVAGIEPGAREGERGAVTRVEADILLVEVDRGLQILAVDVPMIERECGHGILRGRPRAYNFQPATKIASSRLGTVSHCIEDGARNAEARIAVKGANLAEIAVGLLCQLGQPVEEGKVEAA